MSEALYERLIASAKISEHVALRMECAFSHRRHMVFASPIEELFAAGLNAAAALSRQSISVVIDPSADVADTLKIKSYSNTPHTHCTVIPQAAILDYRVDFLCCVHANAPYRGIVVECDGHAFHEKTKDQVARDKARDRALQREGFKVFRFSGSEIWRNAIDRAAEIIDEIDDAVVGEMFAAHSASLSVVA